MTGTTPSGDTAHARRPPGVADVAGVEESEADLREALEGLSRLALGDRPLESSLHRVATLTVLAIPGAQGAGVAMLEEHHPETVCVSDVFVQRVDDIQYRLGEGPCITAAAEARTVVSGSLHTDPAWPRFGRKVARLGVRSVLSLPMVLGDGEVVGALNVYSRVPDAFDPDAARLGEAFAVAAAVAVSNARELMQARRLTQNLHSALRTRATIDHAIGIVMSRRGIGADEAFDLLRQLSQRRNVKLSVVAEDLVREAVARVRGRHSDG